MTIRQIEKLAQMIQDSGIKFGEGVEIIVPMTKSEHSELIKDFCPGSATPNIEIKKLNFSGIIMNIKIVV